MEIPPLEIPPQEKKKIEDTVARFDDELDLYTLLRAANLKIVQLSGTAAANDPMTELMTRRYLYFMDRIATKLSEKFGIKVRGPDIDEKELEAWIARMEQARSDKQFEGTLCSACSYCRKDLESEYVPCDAFEGEGRTGRPWECLMTWEGEPSRQEFLVRMEKEKGQEPLDKYLTKEQELKAEYVRAFVEKVEKEIRTEPVFIVEPELLEEFLFLRRNGFEEEFLEIMKCIENRCFSLSNMVRTMVEIAGNK